MRCLLLSSHLLQRYAKVEGVGTVFKAEAEDCLARAVDDAHGKEAGGVDYLFDAEGTL